METVKLKTARLSLQEPSLDLMNGIVQFLNKNREFHQAYEPIRPEEYYSNKFWESRILEIKETELFDRNLQLFLIDSTQSVIGYLQFSNIVRGAFQACHLGFLLAEMEQGKGFMFEALNAAIHYMFNERNIHRIMANYLVKNIRSERLLMKLNFEKEGLAKDYLLINGKWQNHMLTSLINKDWLIV